MPRYENLRDEHGSADELVTLVPPGEYRVAFEKCAEGVVYGSPRFFVHCRITTDGEHQGKPLMRFYNVPPRGRRIARSSGLYRDYVSVIGRRPPKTFKPVDFLKGCEVLAKVVTVARTQGPNGRWKETPEEIHYSKIESILERTAGWPSGVSVPPQPKKLNSQPRKDIDNMGLGRRRTCWILEAGW